MILNIKLKNFKAHKNREFNFSNKTLILGENGTGKSSIFHAIVYGLFGNSALKYIKSTKISNLIREFSSESEIVLKIKNDDNIYEIRRILRKDGNSYATLSLGDSILATSQSLVDKKIKEIFNINRVSKVLDTLYIPQGDLGKFILQSGTKNLTSLIEKLFDLDYYSTMLEAIKRVIKDLLIEIEKINTAIYQKEKEISKFKKIYGNTSIEELEKMVEEYNAIFSKYNTLQQIYNKLITLKKQINYELIKKEYQILKDINIIKEKVENLEEEKSKLLAEIKSLDIKSVDTELLKYSISDLSKMKQDIEAELQDFSKEDVKIQILQLQQKINIITQFKKLHVNEDEINQLEEEITKIQSDISMINSKIQEISKILEVIKEKKLEKCPVCGKNLSLEDIEKIRENKILELEELKKKRINLIKDLKNKESLLRSLKVEYNKYLALKSRMEEEGIPLEDIEDKLKILEQDLNEKRDLLNKFEQLERITSTINYLLKKDLQKELDKINTELQKLKRELFNKQTLIEKINLSKSLLNEYNRELRNSGYKSEEDLKNNLDTLSKHMEKYKGINQREISLYKIHLAELEDMKEKLQQLKRNYKNLSTLQSVLEKFIASYRKKVANKLSYTFNYFFKRLYKYPDIKEIKLEIKYERQEWKFYIYVMKDIDGKLVWREIKEANLSGGQIKILDLAFRLALAKVLNLNFYTLMLDEPTESLDENVRYSLAELLDSLKEYQIILCTHDELFKDKMSGSVIILSRNQNS